MPLLVRGRIVGLPAARITIYGPHRRAVVKALDLDALNPAGLVDLVTGTIRNCIAEELRPGVFAEWADPRERLRGP